MKISMAAMANGVMANNRNGVRMAAVKKLPGMAIRVGGCGAGGSMAPLILACLYSASAAYPAFGLVSLALPSGRP